MPLNNPLVETFLLNPAISLIANSMKLIKDNIYNHDIEKVTMCDTEMLNKVYKQDLLILNNQKNMFANMEKGDFEATKSCIRNGADIFGKTFNSLTSLHFAKKGNNSEMLKFLHDHHLDADTKDADGQNAMIITARKNNSKIFQSFVDQKLYIHDSNKIEDLLSIHIAVERGNLELVKSLIDKNKELITNKDEFGNTPLHSSAYFGHADIVKFLISLQAEVNALNNDDESPLHLAVKGGHTEIAMNLIDNKAEIDYKNKHGWTPLHICSAKNYIKIIDILITKSDINLNNTNNHSSLTIAISCGSIDAVKILIDNTNITNMKYLLVLSIIKNHYKVFGFLLTKFKKDVNDKDRESLLEIATLYNVHQIVQILLKNNITDASGKNLFYAISLTYEQVAIAFIRSKYTNFNIVRETNRATFLHTAVVSGNKSLIFQLLVKIKNINSVDKNNYTPLHLAAKYNQFNVIKMLWEENVQRIFNKEPDLNVRCTCHGFTPILAAAAANNMNVVRFLLEHDVDSVNVTDSMSNNMLHFAVKNNNVEMAKYLIDKKIDVNHRNKKRLTPLDFAFIRFNIIMIDILSSPSSDTTFARALMMFSSDLISRIGNVQHTLVFLAIYLTAVNNISDVNQLGSRISKFVLISPVLFYIYQNTTR